MVNTAMNTRSIQEFVSHGIATIVDLREALQLAMQLEFATIPPYLCAQWSVRHDPARVEGVLHKIVSQEMGHMALSGNLLAAYGGTPHLAYPAFIPTYPTRVLPGGIVQRLPVDLLPLTRQQLEVFMQIELPAFPPIAFMAALPPATIGEFYDVIIAAIERLMPAIDGNAHQIQNFNVPPIQSNSEAIEALRRLKEEGEGTAASPEQPAADEQVFAHYYLFKEMFVGRRLEKQSGVWGFTGDVVTLPTVYDFSPEGSPSIANRQFARQLSRVLAELQDCWSAGASFNVAAMFELKAAGQALIRQGVRPHFAWISP